MKKSAKIIASLATAFALVFTMITLTPKAVPETLDKTAVWTNDEKTEAKITITSSYEDAIDFGSVLFMGSRCGNHGMETGTIEQTINTLNMYADVDYYGFAYKSDSDNAPTVSGSKVVGSTKFTNGDFAIRSGNHRTAWDFINALYTELVTNEKTYDLIVLEFDGNNVLQDFATRTSGIVGLNDKLQALADKLKPYYDDGKVMWITPYKDSHYVPGEVGELINNKDDDDLDPTDGYDGCQIAARTMFAPSDDITDESGSLATYADSVLQQNYKSIAAIKTYLQDQLVDGFFGTVKITDTLASGLTVKSVSAQYKDEGIWTDCGSDVDVQFSETTTGQKVVGTFGLEAPEDAAYAAKEKWHRDLKMEILVDCSGDFCDSAGAALETNVGDAVAEYSNSRYTDPDARFTRTLKKSSPTLQKQSFEVDFSITEGTSPSFDDLSQPIKVLKGANVTADYTPNENCVLKSITVDGVLHEEPEFLETYKDAYTFESLDADHTLAVVYEKLPAKLTITNTVEQDVDAIDKADYTIELGGEYEGFTGTLFGLDYVDGVAKVTVPAGESKDLVLPPDVPVTVTQDPIPGFDTTVNGQPTYVFAGTIGANDTATVNAQNKIVAPPKVTTAKKASDGKTDEDGKKVTFVADATGGYGKLTYQWKVSTDDGKTWTEVLGAVYESLTVDMSKLADGGYKYICVVTDEFGREIVSEFNEVKVSAPVPEPKAPVTGDAAMPMAMVLIMIAAAAGVVVTRKVKEQ